LTERLPDDHAVFTSLPDRMELPHLGFAGWRTWFVDTVALVCCAIGDHAVAIFYQTDVHHDGRWIDKSPRAMGSAACDAAMRFIITTGARTVVDPFCGQGSALAAANAHGLDAIGVELSKRRATKARSATHPGCT